MACSGRQRRGREFLQHAPRVGHRIAIALRASSACAASGPRSRSPSWRICALAARKVRARFIFWNSSSGIGSPVSQWRANRSSASRSQHQFSMICEGSSTKSHATLVPARRADLHAAQAGGAAGGRTRGRWSPLRDASAAPACRRRAASGCRRSARGAAGTRVRRGPPVMQRIHPGAAALVFARIPVGIKSARGTCRSRRGRCNSGPADPTPARPSPRATRMP